MSSSARPADFYTDTRCILQIDIPGHTITELGEGIYNLSLVCFYARTPVQQRYRIRIGALTASAPQYTA